MDAEILNALYALIFGLISVGWMSAVYRVLLSLSRRMPAGAWDLCFFCLTFWAAVGSAGLWMAGLAPEWVPTGAFVGLGLVALSTGRQNAGI